MVRVTLQFGQDDSDELNGACRCEGRRGPKQVETVFDGRFRGVQRELGSDPKPQR